jgi:hypothetical protein
MTLSRRVAAIETSLSPTQLVLRWLAEAHACGDIPAYAASLLAQDPPVAPLDRLAREAVQAARTTVRGKRPDLVDASVRAALRETVFQFELVMRINVVAHELLDREELIAALFASQLALLLGEGRGKRRPDEPHQRRLELCRRLSLLRVDELLASREARTTVEARYLDGHAALFPELDARFDSQLRTSQEIAASAVRAAELDGVEPAPAEDPVAFNARVGELVADLVEPAKVEALDKLGEGRRAFDIASHWVRGKLASPGTADDDRPFPLSQE